MSGVSCFLSTGAGPIVPDLCRFGVSVSSTHGRELDRQTFVTIGRSLRPIEKREESMQ